MNPLLAPQIGATLECKRSSTPFRKGERWVLTTIFEPHRLVGVECPGRDLVELQVGELGRLLKSGALATVDRAQAERDRQVIELRAAAPLRKPREQHDESGLALFQHFDEPKLI